MEGLFSNCKSLSYLPVISKWNIKNVKYLEDLFSNCESLSFLPNISKGEVNNIREMKDLHLIYKSLSTSNWNRNNVNNISN